MTWLVNWGPLSVVHSLGKPYKQNILSKYSLVTPDAVTVSTIGMRWDILVKQPTTTSMLLYPLDKGSFTIMSAIMCSQGRFGTGRGNNGPVGAVLDPLLLRQTIQEEMYSFTDLVMPGHQ
jgi:hypothetical protein